MGTLAARFQVFVLTGIIDNPVVVLLAPLGNLLVLAVLLRGNHILDNHVFQLELVRQLVDRIVHIVPLAIEVIPDLLQLARRLLILGIQLVQFVGFKV